MKTLYLIRHAKAGWETSGLADFERPLTELGIEHAHSIGQSLQQIIKPDLIISSPALRAITTAKIVAAEVGYAEASIIERQQIYSGGVDELMQIIQSMDAKYRTVFLFGHNPNLTCLLHFLCEENRMNIPTCGAIGIELDLQKWADLTEVDGRVINCLKPPHHESN